ncbi:MAG: aminotransferase class V-fold PLP-dependent enzyme, partial [Thermoanaerobaculia bacterium]
LLYRDRFPILRTKRYLVSHSLGAMPAAAREALMEYADVWEQRGVDGWTDAWWSMSMNCGDAIAPLLGAPAGSVTMLPNVTTASAVAMSAFPFAAPRNRVVMVEGEFPSIRYLYDRLARRLGAEIVIIPRDPTGIGFDLQQLLEAIDERTELVPLSHVLFESSFLVDVEAIAKRCRQVGATLILDVFQSAGIVPIKLREWGVPIAAGGVLKWLCGGPGGGYLYVDPELRPRLEPAFTGWMAHAMPFGFEPPPIRFTDTTLRFALGTPPVPALYAASAGPKIVHEASGGSMDTIRAKSLRQTQKLIDFADASGFDLRTPRSPERRGGTVCIQMLASREIAAAMNAAGIACDHRPNAGIRVSPHFYTSDEELDEAIGEIGEICRRVGAEA